MPDLWLTMEVTITKKTDIELTASSECTDMLCYKLQQVHLERLQLVESIHTWTAARCTQPGKYVLPSGINLSSNGSCCVGGITLLKECQHKQ